MEGRDEQNLYKLEKQIRHVQLWTAIIVLIGALVTTVTTLYAIEKSNQEIKKLLEEKPLEGVWNYHSDYIRWYEREDARELSGNGKVLIFWKNDEQRYDVYVMFKITKSVQGETLLALALNGILRSDQNGWPRQQDFTVDSLEIISRLHHENRAPTTHVYKFTSCRHDGNPSRNRVETIQCSLVTLHSESKITLTRLNSLHGK